MVIISEEGHDSVQQDSSPRANVLQFNVSERSTSVMTTNPSTTALQESTDEERKVVKLKVWEKTTSLITTKLSIHNAKENTQGTNVSNFITSQTPTALRCTATSNIPQLVNDPERITVPKRMEQKPTLVMMTKPSINPPQENPLQTINNPNFNNSQRTAVGHNTASKGNSDNFNVLQKPSARITSELSIHPPQGNTAEKRTLSHLNGSETAVTLTTTSPSSHTAQQIGSGTQTVPITSRRRTTDETFPNGEDIIHLSQLSPDTIYGENF